MEIDRRALLAVGAAVSAIPAPASALSPALPLAPTPPMGWNSWNSFATTITEAQARETAGIMAEKLLPFGYNIFTIDIQWYEPQARSYTYNSKPVPSMDGYGRLIPAPNRFPSSADGKGFAPLAADVHAMGLKFGIHLMRGIPRLAVKRNLPILGTNVRAADIADTSSTCPWNPDMYGVDMTKPGAQEYYHSVFKLYASWGVDFVKMDDMSRPYDAHAAEIDAVSKAIYLSGRQMILSLSPGETPVARAEHVRRVAHMWRISDDFWDEWPMLEAQFTRLENWSPWVAPRSWPSDGGWPDADMLPLGRLALGERDSRFTPDEQQTLMTLWAIARSPLIMGGDLRHLDEATLALLTNRAVIDVNQRSFDSRPHFLQDGARIWSALPQSGKGRYLALFNTTNAPLEISIGLRELKLSGSVAVRDLWSGEALAPASGRFAQTIPSHGAGLFLLG